MRDKLVDCSRLSQRILECLRCGLEAVPNASRPLSNKRRRTKELTRAWQGRYAPAKAVHYIAHSGRCAEQDRAKFAKMFHRRAVDLRCKSSVRTPPLPHVHAAGLH